MKAIYVRVSSDEQAKKGYSVQDQIALCKEKAATNEILDYIDDGYSGGFIDRPALTKLREDVKEGLITEVVCYDPDRLARKLMDQLIVSEEIEKRARITFVNHDYQKTPEGMLFYQLRGAIAEFEKAKINERMSAGRKRKALQGKIVKDPNTYGFVLNKDKDELEIVESEAEVVKLIFELFTSPTNKVQGINGIAKLLTNKGIPTKKNKKVWHRQVVRQILLNEAYAGRFYHNRWDTEGMLANKYLPKHERISVSERPREEWIEVSCPAIIDEDVFNIAQKMLAESRRRWSGKGKNNYLLSGLMRCGNCGNTMTGRNQKNWATHVLQYVDLKNTAGAKNSGCGLRINARDLEEKVWEQIKDILNNPDDILAAINIEEKKSNYVGTEIKRLEDEAQKAKAGIEKILKAFALSSDITDEEMRHTLRGLRETEKKAQDKMAELKKENSEEESSEQTKRMFVEAANFFLNKGEDELTFEDKRHLIRIVVKEIIVYKDHLDIFTF